MGDGRREEEEGGGKREGGFIPFFTDMDFVGRFWKIIIGA